ncbi:exopolysaccharide biosynthesis polyprenyl glycosylphosphotransferase [Pontibacter litorisediminis]|uniref:exopolysaccharide biosynthesis polyprenyl glycosylphosphotransferase n=1 Tax=Pontibacter litorisediminis TaxID=1846260 RepID=UPI0023EA8B52|nr:exopolysaccharide biosynthesis polyprenyl glycosylphosphotransferase [Pontibacter litorisediminis]
MIRSRQKITAVFLEREALTLVFTVFILAYLVDSAAHIDTRLLIIIDVLLLCFIVSYTRVKSTIKPSEARTIPLLTRFVKAYAIFISLAVITYYVFPNLFSSTLHNIKLITAFVLGFPILGLPLHFLIGGIISQIKASRDNRKSTLIAGIGNLAASAEKELYGYRVKGYIKCKNEECRVSQDKIVGDLDRIHDYLKNNPVDEIVIALPVKPSKKVRNILSAADYYGVRVKYVPDYQSLFGEHYKTRRYGHLEAVNVRQLPLDKTHAALVKSTFDLLFSIGALLMLFPVFLCLAILIKIDSPGPVFYCPVRIGKGGKPFRVFKFRSMKENDEVSGGLLSTHKGDPRITKLGRIMRKYSLDELPQFLNVLLGEMSVVGPRPHRSYLNKQLQETEDKYMTRHYYKPGITGWAQVNGWRGPTETKEQKSQRTLHDLWYMENWSLSLDLKIVYMTLFSRKVHKNAF